MANPGDHISKAITRLQGNRVRVRGRELAPWRQKMLATF